MIMPLYFIVKNMTVLYRYTLMLFFGWIILYAGLQLLLWFAFHFAPTDAIKEEMALSDGASGAFVLLFGWSVPLGMTLLFDMVGILYRKGKKAD
jgi:TRAP-type C4-dicarboxylate transport system permease small subunit